jgi:hypothetical protein
MNIMRIAHTSQNWFTIIEIFVANGNQCRGGLAIAIVAMRKMPWRPLYNLLYNKIKKEAFLKDILKNFLEFYGMPQWPFDTSSLLNQ